MCRATTNPRLNASSSPSGVVGVPASSAKRERSELWFLYGQAYDLTRFCANHPGGVRNIMLGRGREATEVFESVHMSGNIDRARAVLEKYRVKEMDHLAPQPEFSFNEDGLYKELARDVRKWFKDNGLSPKESSGYWSRVAMQLVLHFAAFYAWVAYGSVAGAVVSAVMGVTLGFSVFHTASHSGLSHDWRVNEFWSYVWGDLALGFFTPMWFVHHVYGHHAHTGVYRKDPDISNARPVARKVVQMPWKDHYRFQWFTTYILYVVFPGQWFGNVIQYIRSMVILHRAKRPARIFGLPINKGEARITEIIPFVTIVAALFAYLSWSFGLVFAAASMAVHGAVRSIMYWAIVFPNHDSDKIEHHEQDSDWGVQQIRHSAGFAMPRWLSYITGGMNYQIEHHLFVAVHHEHYPELQKIVKKHCEKRGIEYPWHDSWLDALKGNFRLQWALSHEDGGWIGKEAKSQ